MNDPLNERAKLIKGITTPIAFFAMVVVATESLLAWTAVQIGEGADRTFLLVSGVSILTLLTLVVALLAYFRPWVLSGQPPPEVVIKVNELKPPPYSATTNAIRYFLRGIRESYFRTLSDAHCPSPKHLRINVMLVVSRGSGKSKESVLAIKHVDYPTEFQEDEYSTFFRKGEAKCGRAWELLQQTYYAADRREEDAQFVEMSATSPGARSRRSVLSTPVVIRGECIAVLNLDSDEESCSTQVHLDIVRNVFQVGAQEIVPFLFPTSNNSEGQ